MENIFVDTDELEEFIFNECKKKMTLISSNKPYQLFYI